MSSVFYRAFALLLCCTTVIAAAAQDKPAYGYIPEMKVTLLALDGLMDPRPFLETSFERRTDATHSAELAVGVLLPHSFYDERIHHLFDNRNAGIRLRLNYKIYISQRGEEEQSDHSNSYWAPELMFNYNTLKSTGWYERFDNVYQQQLTYTRRQTAIGWGVKWGQQWFFTRRKKIFLDYFAGVGVRCLIVGRRDTPEDVTLFNGFSAIGFGARGPGTYWHPYLNFGLKLGLVLR